MAHEPTRAMAWLYGRLSANAALLALLNADRAAAEPASRLIRRYVAVEGVAAPYLICNHMGTPPGVPYDTETSTHLRMWNWQLWDIKLVSALDDAFIEQVMDTIDAELHGRAHEAALDGEVGECWRFNLVPPAVEDETGLLLVHTVAEYALRVVV